MCYSNGGPTQEWSPIGIQMTSVMSFVGNKFDRLRTVGGISCSTIWQMMGQRLLGIHNFSWHRLQTFQPSHYIFMSLYSMYQCIELIAIDCVWRLRTNSTVSIFAEMQCPNVIWLWPLSYMTPNLHLTILKGIWSLLTYIVQQ